MAIALASNRSLRAHSSVQSLVVSPGLVWNGGAPPAAHLRLTDKTLKGPSVRAVDEQIRVTTAPTRAKGKLTYVRDIVVSIIVGAVAVGTLTLADNIGGEKSSEVPASAETAVAASYLPS